MDTLEAVKGVLAETLGIDAQEVGPETTFESLGVDSLDMVEMTSELEDALDVQLGTPDDLATVGDLVSYVDGLK